MTGSTITVSFLLNGQPHTVDTAADTRLIDLLRDDLAMVAAKKACGIGRCGACSVLSDGLPMNACLLMAWQLDGRSIVSPEGLDVLPEATVLRAALAAENAFQCGYCAPGFTIVLTALLRDNPDAGEAEISAALEGNLCRCTGYQSILRGALVAARTLAGATPGAAGEASS